MCCSAMQSSFNGSLLSDHPQCPSDAMMGNNLDYLYHHQDSCLYIQLPLAGMVRPEAQTGVSHFK